MTPGSATARKGALIAALVLACVLGSAFVPPNAAAFELASMSAGIRPARLGSHSAVELSFWIDTSDGTLPSALTGIVLRYPRSFGLGTSELGLASCEPSRLLLAGPKACPRNSIMGGGNALTQFQVSPLISQEGASIALVAGPSHGGYVKILIGVTAAYPVSTRLVMSTLLLPGRLNVSVPLVPGIPEGPDVAVVAMKLVIGGHLTYATRSHGRRVFYHPQGILIPPSCPKEGFPFGATFSFLDGSTAEASTVVRCPRASRRGA